MTVHCPHCSTGYLLPDHLLGERGSRVRCPACTGAFVVLPENGHAGGAGERSPAANDNGHAPPGPEPSQLAAEILDRLASQLGDALEQSRSRRTILSEHGPALLDAYDEFRRRSEAASAPAVFRASLRDRWGFDLSPTQPS